MKLIRCPRCGHPVLNHTEHLYQWKCAHCGEVFEIERANKDIMSKEEWSK